MWCRPAPFAWQHVKWLIGCVRLFSARRAFLPPGTLGEKGEIDRRDDVVHQPPRLPRQRRGHSIASSMPETLREGANKPGGRVFCGEFACSAKHKHISSGARVRLACGLACLQDQMWSQQSGKRVKRT
ncbi:hypothetical protein PsYK624_012850 [Phanerochaete sordida]|uniref:Secreted protein n=1 Tax=Phanerochaete sordida TaxID=48140 RepID=A0A9P3FXW1_9APHY|nr:hypothetical protein PsYK624_012850 [Phanerochaete sordida]